MTVAKDSLFLLICGKGEQERAQLLEQLYMSLRKRWRVRFCSPNFTRQRETASARAEIEIQGELGDADKATIEQLDLDALFTAECSPDIVVASVSCAIAAVKSTEAEQKQLRIIDLNRRSQEDALKAAQRYISRMDADKIGSFAGIGGFIEVGLGSTLHVYKIPFKGHFLSSLQNLLLISFGKALNGRGLVRISFISAMLKAFSPMGNAIRPMMFIFLQGALFSLPAHLLGWNLFSVLAGSVLMGWLTLGISLSMDYLMYGKSIFDAAQNGVGQAFDAVGFGIPSLSQLLIFAFLLRAALSLTVGSVAYFGNVLPAVSRVARAAVRRKKSRTEPSASKRAPKPAPVAALFGLFRPKFLVAFLLSLLLMRFFTDLSSAELTTTAIRGLCISYLGFLLMHRIDVQALGARLDKRFGLDLEKSLPIAAKRIGRPPRRD